MSHEEVYTFSRVSHAEMNTACIMSHDEIYMPSKESHDEIYMPSKESHDEKHMFRVFSMLCLSITLFLLHLHPLKPIQYQAE